MALYSSLLAFCLVTIVLVRFEPGDKDPANVGLVLIVLTLTLLGCCLRRPPSRGRSTHLLRPVVLGGMVAAEVVWLAWAPPSVMRSYPDTDPHLTWFRLGVVLLALLVASYA